MRRALPLALMATGLALLGSSLSGMASLDRALSDTAATPATAPQTEQPVRLDSERDCPWRDREHRPEV